MMLREAFASGVKTGAQPYRLLFDYNSATSPQHRQAIASMRRLTGVATIFTTAMCVLAMLNLDAFLIIIGALAIAADQDLAEVLFGRT